MAHYISEHSRVQSRIEEMVGRAKEKKMGISPLVSARADKVVEILKETKRKGAMSNEREYNKIRERVEQGLRRENPFNDNY